MVLKRLKKEWGRRKSERVEGKEERNIIMFLELCPQITLDLLKKIKTKKTNLKSPKRVNPKRVNQLVRKIGILKFAL